MVAEARAQDPISGLIMQLGSSDWSQRSEAVNQLLQLHALESVPVQAALTSTLDSENQSQVTTLRQSSGQTGASGVYGEGYSEYYATLLGTVLSFASFSAPTTARVLTESAYNPQSAFAGTLASHADVILSTVLNRFNSDVPTIRQSTVAFAGAILHIFKPPNLTQAGVTQLTQLIARATADPDAGVRAQASNASQSIADVNNDGSVDCLDIALVKLSFGKRIGQPGFDARGDVNLDGVVDIRDQSVVSQKLPVGTRCQ